MARVSRVAAVAPQAGGGVAASCGHGDCKSTEASRRSVHRGEPDLERDFSRDDVDRGERVLRGGRKRQAVQQKAGARHSEKCSQRQSSRARSSSSSASEWGSGAAAGRGAIVGSSIMLNKMPVELLENVLSYLARGPQESSASSCGQDASGGGDSPAEGSSPTTSEVQVVEHASQRGALLGKGSSEPAPVQILFKLCARTCRRWNQAVRSPQVLRKLSMSRLPLPAATVTRLADESADSASPAAPEGGTITAAAGVSRVVQQAGDELLDPRVEGVLRVASKAGNDGAQFLLGLYLSRQKTFALLCLACSAASAPAAEGGGEQVDPAQLQAARRTHEQLRDAVFEAYDEGVELLRSAADLLHPNALYQLGMLAFGGTDVKLRARLYGHEGSSACGDCVLGEEHAELYWRRAAELGHLESRLIVDGDFRLNHLQEMEDRMLPCESERRSWRMCAGNRLLSSAKRPQSSSSKARECSHEECGMYTLLCEFKQCAGCATSHKKQR